MTEKEEKAFDEQLKLTLVGHKVIATDLLWQRVSKELQSGQDDLYMSEFKGKRMGNGFLSPDRGEAPRRY